MRLAYFITKLNVGGAERRLTEEALRLARRGHQVSVVTLQEGGGFWGILQRQPAVELMSLFPGHRSSILGLAQAAFRLRRRLYEQPVDLLVSSLHWGNLIARLATLGRSSPVLIWELYGSSAPFGIKRQIAFQLCRLLARGVELGVADSLEGGRFYRRVGILPRKLQVIRSGVDIQKFRPDREARLKQRRLWGVGEREPLIGVVGRFALEKGLETFLRAFKRVVESRPDVIAVMVGDGQQKLLAKLQSLSRQFDLQNRLLWVGESNDLPSVYNALDVFCMSSIHEGTPNALLEAMACDIPCVVTDVGDCRDILGGVGQVVPPRDPPALAEELLRCLAGRAEAEGGFRSRILRNFALERMVDELEQLILTQVASSSPVHQLRGTPRNSA